MGGHTTKPKYTHTHTQIITQSCRLGHPPLQPRQSKSSSRKVKSSVCFFRAFVFWHLTWDAVFAYLAPPILLQPFHLVFLRTYITKGGGEREEAKVEKEVERAERKGGKRWKGGEGERHVGWKCGWMGWWRWKTRDERWPLSCCHSDTHSLNTPGTSPRKPPACSTTHHQHCKQSLITTSQYSSHRFGLYIEIFISFQRLLTPYLRTHSSDATDFLREFSRHTFTLTFNWFQLLRKKKSLCSLNSDYLVA